MAQVNSLATNNGQSPGTNALDLGMNQDPVVPMSFGDMGQAAGSDILSPKPAFLGALRLEDFFDVPVHMIFEVGRVEIPIKQLMELSKGSFIELRQVSVDSIDIRINEKLVGTGETIALQQRYGIRFGELEIFPNMEELTHGTK